MLRAELAKARYLPLPRWTAAAVLASAVITGAALIVFTPADADTYISIPPATVDMALVIAGAVFGVWVGALEFGAGTLQRTLTAEPDRNRVLIAKLSLVVAAAAVAGAAAAAAAGGLTHLAIIRAGVPDSAGDLARAVFAVIPDGLFASIIGFGFGLLARSMGGGITLALAFLFVLSGLLTLIPTIKNIAYSQASADLTAHLSGTGSTTHNAGVALLIMLAWTVVIVGSGWWLFLRADLK